MILTKNQIVSFFLAAGIALSPSAMADEGGVSFWLPGEFGSFAAVPADTGWSLATIYYHGSSSAGKTREFDRGKILAFGLDVKQDIVILMPTYVFSDPLWGGQAAVNMAAFYGRATVDVSAAFYRNENMRSGKIDDSMTAFGDLYPMASVKWNDGDNNYMIYAMGGIPTGKYDPDRLASLGSNHWALDVGGAYTYLNMKTGYEFSVTAGLTYNWENPDTEYKNGIDGHIDWGASTFLSDTLNLGVAGYFFYQLTGDSGAGANLGDFKSRVNGIGPQLNWFFPVGKTQGIVNLKGYWEFGSAHRPEGWNSWLVVSFPL